MESHLLNATAVNLARAARAIREGDLVAMPTETVYGLAGDAFNVGALQKIFEAKERPTFDPLIIHVAASHRPSRWTPLLCDQKLIDPSALTIRAIEQIEELALTFWPGPLTLILPKHLQVPDLATSGLSTVAIRAPKHPVARALILESERPLAAPSANRFGRISPTSADDVLEELEGKIPWILDGGPCEYGLESSILGLDTDADDREFWRLLRPGAVAQSSIEAILNQPLIHGLPQTSPHGLVAPGLLKSHYAPSKPLYLLPQSIDSISDWTWAHTKKPEAYALLLQRSVSDLGLHRLAELFGHPPLAIESLSPDGNSSQAARRLFMTLRKLDHTAASVIFAEPCARPLKGLDYAIEDRLLKASHRGNEHIFPPEH